VSEIVVEEAVLQWRSVNFSLSLSLSLRFCDSVSEIASQPFEVCESNVATLRLLYYCWVRVRF